MWVVKRRSPHLYTVADAFVLQVVAEAALTLLAWLPLRYDVAMLVPQSIDRTSLCD